jgi:hypothetical protein
MMGEREIERKADVEQRGHENRGYERPAGVFVTEMR